MASNEPKQLYRITSTVPEMIPQPDGRYEPGYRVSFTTALGQHSYVVVPRSENLTETAHAAAEVEARRLVDMHSRAVVPLYQPPQS